MRWTVILKAILAGIMAWLDSSGTVQAAAADNVSDNNKEAVKHDEALQKKHDEENNKSRTRTTTRKRLQDGNF